MSQTIEERVASQEVTLRFLSDQIASLATETKALSAVINSAMKSLTEDRGADSRRVDTLHRDLKEVSQRLSTLEIGHKPILVELQGLKEWQKSVTSRATWTASLVAGLISFVIATFAASGAIKEYLRAWIAQ